MDEQSVHEPGRRRLPVARLVAAAAVIVVVLWFGFANGQRVRVDYLVTERRSRLIYVILASAVLGALADRLLQWRYGRERGPRAR
ncbi:MAG: hypothetical protein ACXVWF_09120 [Actinomycetota bacterium]